MRLRFLFLIIIGLGVFSFYKKGESNFFKNNRNIPTRNLVTVTVLPQAETIKKPKPLKPKEVKIFNLTPIPQLEEKQVINQKPKQKVEAPIIPKTNEPILNKSKTNVEETTLNEVRLAVEEMPNFPGCEQISIKNEMKTCSDNKLLRFLNKNIQYPKNAITQGIEGTVYISFIVEKSGKISNTKIVRDIGGGCGKEALRVVESMPKWNAGKQNGKPMRVRFNLPVRFQLN